MSALGQKQTSGKVRLMSASLPKADIGTGPRLPSTQQLRQPGNIRRDPSRLVAGEANIQCYCGMISSIKL